MAIEQNKPASSRKERPVDSGKYSPVQKILQQQLFFSTKKQKLLAPWDTRVFYLFSQERALPTELISKKINYDNYDKEFLSKVSQTKEIEYFDTFMRLRDMFKLPPKKNRAYRKLHWVT